MAVLPAGETCARSRHAGTVEPGPLLRNSGRNMSADSDTLCRRILCSASWVVFVVLLLEASCVPVIFAVSLQQFGVDIRGQYLRALFPLGWWHFSEVDEKVELIDQDYLLLTAPWFLLATLWEMLMVCVILPHSRRPPHTYRFCDTISSLSTSVLLVLVAKVAWLDWVSVLYDWIWHNLRLTSVFANTSSGAACWACLVLGDALYYAYHRGSHWNSWMWASHMVHHSSEEFNLSTALRQPFSHVFTPTSLVSIMSLAFLFPPELAVWQGQVGLLYQFWIHTQLVPRLPIVELVFNSPSLHRIHHARNPWLLGKNYGSIFMIWDRLGGTFMSEDADAEQLLYGVIPQFRSWNPAWLNFTHFYYMWAVQRKWHGWRTPWVHWTPPNGVCPPLGSRMNPYEKYDIRERTASLRAYIFITFGVSAFASLAFLSTGAGGDPHELAGIGIFTAVFVFALWSFGSLGQLQSADSARSLRRALLGEIGRQLLIVGGMVVAWMVVREGAHEAQDALVASAVSTYAVLHVGAFAWLWHQTYRWS